MNPSTRLRLLASAVRYRGYGSALTTASAWMMDDEALLRGAFGERMPEQHQAHLQIGSRALVCLVLVNGDEENHIRAS